MTTKKEVFDFIKIGMINTIFYYLVYIFFLFIGFNYYFSALLATSIGVLFNFKTFGKYVFFNEDKSRIIRFIATYTILYIVNILFINIFNYILNNYYFSGFLSIFPYSFFSFILNKKFVFNQKD